MTTFRRVPAPPSKDLIDPRQREAAALLLSAIDLPAPAAAAAKQWIEAASVCPGITADRVVLGDRQAQLRRARELIDQVLDEVAINGLPTADEPPGGLR